MSDDLFKQGQKGIPGLPGEEYPMGVRPTEEPAGEPALDEYGYRPANDDEQGVYEQFVVKAQEFITGNAASLVSKLNNDQRPVYQTVGHIGLQIAEMVTGLAGAGGQEVEEDMILAAGEEIVEMLMELGDAAQIWPFAIDSDKYDEAMAMSLMYGAEQKARQVIDQGDPEVKQSYEDKLAFEISREQSQGKGPAPEFYDNLELGKTELPRRQIHGVT